MKDDDVFSAIAFYDAYAQLQVGGIPKTLHKIVYWHSGFLDVFFVSKQ